MADNLTMFSLKGKVALVTGAHGLYGRQITEAVAGAGAAVYIASRDTAKLASFAEELARAGTPAQVLPLDLSDESSIQQAIRTIEMQSGRLDILVNNAVTRNATVGWDQSMDAYDASLRVNASGLFYITNAAAALMKKHNQGSIINIGSMMGMVGVENANYDNTDMAKDLSPIYFYEKGGMINFTRHAASILGPWNIRVNCVSPGGFQTESHPEPFVKQYSARTQLGRMANADDLKGVVILLASEASAYITGVNIPVDGGYTAK